MSLRKGKTVGLRSWCGICEPQVAHGAHLAFLPVRGTVCVGFFFFFFFVSFFLVWLVGFLVCFCSGIVFSENDSSCCHLFSGAPGMACQHVLNSFTSCHRWDSILPLPTGYRLPQFPFVWGCSCSLLATLWCEMCEKARRSSWCVEVSGESTRVRGLPGTVGGRHMGHTRPFNSAKLHLRCTSPPSGDFQSAFPLPWLEKLVQSIQVYLWVRQRIWL